MKSYTLDKLNEARDALNRDDHVTCEAALNELIKRHELIQETFEMKRSLTDGTDIQEGKTQILLS